MTTTYTKLRDGSWGLRTSSSSATPGTTLTVTKRDGQTKSETIGRILWTGQDRDGGGTVTLCTIAGSGQSSSRYDSDGVRLGGYRRGYRTCRTGGNCSSMGSGRSCGASDCDG